VKALVTFLILAISQENTR
jgi:hypothetical protein